MAKPIIGVAANESQNPGTVLYEMPILYTPLGYTKAIQEVGGLAMVLPISEKAAAKEYVSQIDKLVLAGGQNVSPKFYGEAMTTADSTFLARDEFELALIEAALLQKKPIFAVCRGMQLLNVALGGTLHQDISQMKISHMQDPIPRQVATHEIFTEKGSILNHIYGDQTMVNSFHHQAVDHLATNFKETAWSPDDVIEGIEDRQQHLLGVQWHPDFAYDALPQELSAFRYLVESL
ncbi:gamma-glutamyl-gamma-aminobutyrate hydrolase family protein [Enterococcus sp. LJL120]